MTKAVVPRERAKQDAAEAIDYYLGENSPDAALGFIDALERAYSHIGRNPGSGSSRYAHELNLPGLRSWPLQKYPHLIFYVERSDHVDVWRVLQGHRDIPAWMREPLISTNSRIAAGSRKLGNDRQSRALPSALHFNGRDGTSYAHSLPQHSEA